MKKFMIFLLMAFLYLGTCQARSEASHPNNAKLKLLSWVSPTPSESFLTRADQAPADSLVVTPSGTVFMSVTNPGTRTRQFTATLLNPTTGVTVQSHKWYVDGALQQGSTATVTVGNLIVGTHTLYCEAVLSNNQTTQSEMITLVVNQNDVEVEIAGASEVCEDATVTLTATMERVPLSGFRYLWRLNGEALKDGVNSVEYINFGQQVSFKPDSLLGGPLTDPTTLELTVEISYAGCNLEISPVFPLLVNPRPQIAITAPDSICATGNTVFTAVVTGIAPDQYKWFVKKSDTTILQATTTTPELTLVNDSLLLADWEEVGVAGIYNVNACNTDTQWIATPKEFENKPEKLELSRTIPAPLSDLETEIDTLCLGSQLQFTATDENTNFGVATYTWTVNGTPVESTGKTLTYIANEIGLYEIVVSATYADFPCEADVADTVKVFIEEAPQMLISGNNVICVGGQTQLTATDGFQTYAWFGPNGAIADNDKNTLDVTAAGTYTVTGTTKGGCQVSAQYSVTQFGADLQVSATEYYVCPGTTVALNANLDGWMNENISYAWFKINGTDTTALGFTGSTYTATIPADASDSVKYMVKATAGQGCEMMQNIVVNIITPTSATLTVTLDTNKVCAGNQVTATVTGATNVLYAWYVNGVQVPGENMAQLTLNMNQAGAYTFNATLANTECALVMPMGNAKVNVYDAPAITITGNDVICQNDTAYMTATEVENAKYVWAGPGVNEEQDSTNVFKTVVPGAYSVTMLTENGCTSSAQFAVEQLGGNLQVYASQLEVCPGSPVMLNAVFTGYNNQNISYVWYQGSVADANVIDSTSTIVANPMRPATGDSVRYYVKAFATAQDGNDNVATACAMTSHVDVYVLLDTAVKLTLEVDPIMLCNGGQFGAKVKPVDENVVINYYTWFLNGVEIAGQNLDSIRLNLLEPGTYTVGVKPAENMCFAYPATLTTKTITVGATPEIAMVGNNVICNGDSATIVAVPSIEGAYKYTWEGLNLNNANVNDSALTTAAAGVYTVTVEDTIYHCIATADFTIYQNGGDLQLMSNKTTICAGESVMLNANLDGFNNENISYEWTVVGGEAAGNGSTITVNPGVTTKYAVKAIAGNCVMNDTIEINVNGVDTIYTVVTMKNPRGLPVQNPICIGQQVLYLHATSTLNNEPYDVASYTWYQDGMMVTDNGLVDIEPNLFNVGAHYFAAKANVEGCAVSMVSAEELVIAHAAPELTISGNNVICNGDTATLEVHIIQATNVPAVTEADFTYNYNWSNEGTDSVIKVTTPGLYTVTVSHNWGGCSSTASVNVTTFGGDIQLTPSKTVTCAGEAVVLNANLNGFNNELVSYAWNTEDTASTITVFPTDTTTYVVTANAGNCSMKDSITIYAAAVETIATVVSYNGNAVLCQGQEAWIFTAKSYVGEDLTLMDDYSGHEVYNAAHYVWYLDGIEIPGQNLNQIELNPAEIGTHYVTAKAVVEGCNIAKVSTPKEFKVIAAPEVLITGNNVVCNGDTAVLVANAHTQAVDNGLPLQYSYKYAWSNGDDKDTIKVTEAGIYTVTVTTQLVNAATQAETETGCHAIATVEVVTFGGNLQMAASKTVTCAGEAVVLNANLNGFNNELVSYAWNTEDTASTITVFPTDTTTYVVTAVAGNCTMKDSITIYAAAGRTISTVVNFEGNFSTIYNPDEPILCQGQQVYFYTATSYEGDLIAGSPAVGAPTYPAVHYIWYLDGVEIPGQNLNQIELTAAEIGQHALSAKAVVEGCDVAVVSPAKNFIVVAAPEVAITGNSVICNGDTAVLVANVVTPAVNGNPYSNLNSTSYTYKYAWSNGEDNDTIKVTENGTYTVTVTNQLKQNNVVYDLCSTIATVEVVTFGGDLQVNADQTTVCKNTPVVLNANLDGFNNENISYEWTKVGGSVIGNGSTITVTPDVTTKYAVVATAGTACVMNDTIEITVTPTTNYQTVIYNNQVRRPNGTLVYSNQDDRLQFPAQYCEGQEIALYYISDSKSTGTTSQLYNWYVDGNLIAENTRDLMIPAGMEIGSHYITAMAVVSGCDSATMSNSLNFIIHAAPEVTISGNNVICNGDTAFMTANATTMKYHPNSNVVYDHKYTWSNGKEFAVDTITTAGTYTVTATNIVSGKEMCSTTASVEVMTFGADAQIIADNTVICEGEYVTLRANFEGFVNENASYVWSEVGGNQLGNGSNLTVNPTDDTQYVLTVNAGECSISDTIDITVHERPGKASVELSANTICAGGQVTAEVTNHSHGLSYIWYVNGQELPGENRSELTLNLDEAGDYVFQARTVNQYGCQAAQLPANSPEHTVTVVPTPQITLSGNNLICNGDSAVIVASVLPEETHGPHSDYTYEYAWSNGTDKDTLVVYAGGVYTLTVTNVARGMNCYATASVEVMTSGADAQIIADNTVICEGEYVTLRANFEGFVNENASYVWSEVGGNQLGNGSNLTVNPTDDTQYVLTVNAGECSISDTIDITVHERPEIANVSASADYICQGSQVSFTVDPANTNYTYEWYLNGLPLTTAGTSTFTYNFNQPGAYQIAARIVNEFGCAAVNVDYPMDTVQSYYIDGRLPFVHSTEVTVPLTVTVLPTPDVQLSGNNIICNGAEAVITANVIPVSDDVAAQIAHEIENIIDNIPIPIPSWARNGVVNAVTAIVNNFYTADFAYDYAWSNGTNDQVLTTDQAGTYTVTVTNTAHDLNCYATASIEVYTNGADLQVYADKMEVCEGEMVVLNANLDGFTADNIRYDWEGHRLVQDTGSTVSAYPTVNDHVYTVTASTTGANPGCTLTGTIDITVHPVPDVVTVTANRNTICEGGQVTFSASGDATAYIWYQNGVEIQGENQAELTINFNEIGNYSLSAKAVSAYGCVSAEASEPVVIKVVMQPTVEITGDPMICHNNFVELFANINDTDDDLDYTYEWRMYNYSLGTGFDMSFFNTQFTYDNPNFLNSFVVASNTSNDYNNHFISSPLEARDYPYIFTVVVTSPEGCRTVSAPYYVYVGEDPEVVATVDYDTICAGGTVHAVAHIGNYNTPDLVYRWFANGVEVAYGMEPTLTIDLDETTDLTVQVTQTTTGCTATSDAVTVTVIEPKNIHQIVAINHDSEYVTVNADGTQVVCEGAQLDVVAYFQEINGEDTTNYIDSSLTYVWTLNGMQLQTVHGPQFSAQAYIYDGDPVDYVYTAYVVYDIPGCELVPVASNVVHVKRNPIVIIEGNHNFCYSGPTVDNVVLTAWVDGTLDADAQYTWYKNGEESDNVNGYNNHYIDNWPPTYDNPYVFTVEVTNGDGCTTMSAPFEVNVYERPYVNVTGDADSICEHGNITLRANLDNYNDPMLTFQWYKDEVNNTHILPGATHEIETFEPELGTTDYIVKVTHLMDFNTQYCVAFDTFQVNVAPIPEVTASNDLNGVKTICEGRDVKMIATTTGGIPGGEVYTWYRNGELIENVNSDVFVDSPVAINGQPTQYVYSVKVKQAASGCESGVYFIDTITVNPTPVVELVTDPIVCIAEQGTNNIVMAANVEPYPTTPVTYHWFEDNHEIAATTDSIYSTYRGYRDYPYSFSVRVANEYGCIAESSALVYVNDKPVVNISATDTLICVGGEVELAAALNDWNAGMLTYQWYDGDVLIPGATSLEFDVNPAEGNHNYNIRIYQLDSHCQAASDTIKVQVNADPVITSITDNVPATNTVCDGYQVVLTANVQGGVQGGEEFTWFRNGDLIEGATAPVFSEVLSALNGEPTAYKYAVSVKQTAPGCESNIYVNVDSFVVNPNPTVEIMYDPIVCVDTNNNITLVANAYPTNGSFTYRWFEDNVEIDTVTGNTLVTTKPFSENAYNFSVMLVNEIACSAVAEAHVMVNAAPVVNITVTEDSICVGGEITLAAALNDWNADMLTFQWYDNNVLIEGATSLQYTVVPTLDTHVYTLKVNQITSGCEAISNALTVKVNPIPVVESVVASQENVCYGGQITLTANTNDGNADGGVFTWYRNGVLMEGATARVINDTPGTVDNNTQTYVYTAVVTYPEAGCTSLPTNSRVVTVYPNPVVAITGDQHVCETDTVFLIANVDTTGMNVGGLHYTWYEDGMIRDNMAYGLGDRNFFAEYKYPRTEPYRFTVDVWRDGVEAGCVAHSEVFNVYVYPQPVVNITASETEICENGQVTLTANLRDPNEENIIYQWYEVRYDTTEIDVDYDEVNNQYITATVVTPYHYNIPGATSPVYTTNLTKTITLGVVVLQTNSECSATDEVEIIVNPIPVVTNITVNNLDTLVVCNGAPVMVQAAIQPANAAGAVYTWFRNGDLIEGVNTPVFTENVFTTNNHVTVNHYSAVVTLPASGCVSEMSADAGVVEIHPAPTTVSISGVNVICENDSTVLTAYSDVPGTFTWSNNVQGNTTTVHAGTYTVTMVTVGGCELTSDPFVVEAFGTDIFVNATPSHICAGDHTTLQVTQDGWQGNVTYQWDVNADSSISTTVDVTPEVTTTYHVTATVESTNGTCTAEGEVTVEVTPLPNKLTVSADTNAVCEGSQITFTATGANDAVSYIWYANGVEIPGENQAQLTVNFDHAGVYEYSAKAKNADGCVSALASDPVSVTINAAPASVTISGNTVICNGGSTTLYANVDPNEPAVYAWYKDGVSMNTNTASINVTVPGSYTVEASFNGCTTVSDPVVVTVEEAPQLQLTATESTICVGGNTLITAEATGWNNGDVNYDWSCDLLGSTFTYSGSAYNFEPVTAGSYVFNVTASQATSGCNANASITITVNNIPATPVVTVSDSIICTGGQVVVSTAMVAGATYTWFRNGSVITDADANVIYESPVAVAGDPTTYVYNVEVSLANSGCTSERSANAIVNVIPEPQAEVTVIGNTTLCDGGSTTLKVNVTPAVDGYQYQWYKNNVLIVNATSDTYVIENAEANENAYNYRVVVTANAGCTVSANAPAITVVADPQVTTTISDEIVCLGGTATLTATAVGGSAGANGMNNYEYKWYNNLSTTTPVGVGAVYTIPATQPVGQYTYWVEVTSVYGCATSTENTPEHFNVIDVPAVAINVANGYNDTICNGGSTALKANVTGGFGAPTYQWYKNGNILTGETNEILMLDNLAAGANDTYKVVVSQEGVGCFNESTINLNSIVTVVPTYQVEITGSANVCQGGTLTLNASVNGVIDGDYITYQWYKVVNGDNGIAISGANSASYETSELLLGNSYDYYVVVTSAISGCTVASNSVTANVVPVPSVTINGANTVCEGGNLTLNAFINGGVESDAAYNYIWSWTGAANGSDTTAVPTYNVNLNASDAAAPYYFTVTILRADNTGCTATSAAHEVNILTAPTVTVTADNNYVCQNGDVTFTANVTPVGTYNYVWTINDQEQPDNTATITTSMSNVGAINASVVVSAAGASSSCTATATLAVPVQVVAAPTVSIAADHLTMCVGGTTTLTSTVNSNVPGDFTYQWAINGIEVTGAIASSFVQPLNAAGSYEYTLRVAQNNNLNCNSTWSAPVTVQVAEQPVVTLNSQDGLNICEGGSITLNAVVTNYGNTVNGATNSSIYGAMTFDWTSNGINVHHNTNINNAMNQVTETLNTVGNYNYQVSVDAAGYNCQPQVSNVVTVGVVGNPSWTDVHVYSPNGTDVCLGEMVILQASIQGGATDGEGSTSGHIQWVVANGTDTILVNGGLGGNSYDIPAAAGHYTYIPTFVGNIGSGCQLTNTNDVQVGVDVYELPTASFTSGDGTALCANDGSASAELVLSFTGVAPFVYEVVDNYGHVVAHATTLANTATIYVAPSTQTTYRITLIQDAHCENTALDATATATVYVNDIQFAENTFMADCDAPVVTVYFNMISGNPTAAFTVVYENVQFGPETGTINNGTATFATPSAPGDYNAVITIDGCDYDIVVRVPMSNQYNYSGTLPLMDQRWDDVVVVNCNPATNGGHTFVGFQWYHNGVAIPGATYSNYQDKGGLNGYYSVELTEYITDASGNSYMVTYMTCDYTPDYGAGNVKVYPVPANVRQEITIELDLTSEELEGAVLDIFSVTGAHINHVVDLQPITKIEGFKAQGTYFGRILTGTNEIKTVKFVIVK